MTILGIDPGTTRMGYGVVDGPKPLRLVACGIIGDESASSQDERLGILERDLSALLAAHQPDLIGVERLFFSKNKRTAMLVAEARGVALAVCSRAGIPVLEFTPNDVKSVVAGDGACDKNTLARVVSMTLGIKSIPGPDDISDAVAVALRAHFEPK